MGSALSTCSFVQGYHSDVQPHNLVILYLAWNPVQRRPLYWNDWWSTLARAHPQTLGLALYLSWHGLCHMT